MLFLCLFYYFFATSCHFWDRAIFQSRFSTPPQKSPKIWQKNREKIMPFWCQKNFWGIMEALISIGNHIKKNVSDSFRPDGRACEIGSAPTLFKTPCTMFTSNIGLCTHLWNRTHCIPKRVIKNHTYTPNYLLAFKILDYVAKMYTWIFFCYGSVPFWWYQPLTKSYLIWN